VTRGRRPQISVSRAGPYGAASAKNKPTGSAYITFRRNEDARRCIETMHNTQWDGAPARQALGRPARPLRCLAPLRARVAAAAVRPRRARPRERARAGKVIKACYGTTKYCNAFLKGVACNNSDCLYLHDVGAPRRAPRLDVYVWQALCCRHWYAARPGC